MRCEVVAIGTDPDALPEQVIAQCKASLADFKVPRAVFIVDHMPRSTLEKIYKAELRNRLPVAG